MSNKMLAKRLLATGMSVAMSATLFATNSITIFAEEGGADEVIAIAAPADDSGEPAEAANFPKPEFSSETSDPVTFAESEGEKANYRTDIVETTNTMDIYVSDMNSVDVDGNQLDYYDMVNKADVEGQTLDYTQAEKIVHEGEVTVYLEDENHEVVTVKNKDGEDVPLKLKEGFTEDDLHEIQVVTKEDDSLHVLNRWEKCCNVVYGSFAEDGTFIEGEKGAEGVQAYYLDENNQYVAADTMYSYKDGNETVYISEEMYKALTEGSDLYEVKREYEYNGESYSEDELKEVEKIKDVVEWSYTVEGDPEDIDEELTHFTHEVGPFWDKHEEDKFININYTTVKITGEQVLTYMGYAYPCYKYFYYDSDKDGKYELYARESVYFNHLGSDLTVGQVIPFPWGDEVNTAYDKVHKVTPATADKVVTDGIYIKVYDKNDPDGDPVLVLDKAAYDSLTAGNVALVKDMYEIRNDWGCPIARIDKEKYTIVTEREIVTNVMTVNYYTVQDKYEKDPVDVTFTMGDQEYTLSVNFWQNDRIGATGIEVTDNNDGTADVTVYFAYSDYSHGFWKNDGYDSVTYKIKASEFGQDGTARMTIKYTPAYLRTNVRPIEVEQPVEFITRAVLADTHLASDADVVALLAEYIGEEIEDRTVFIERDYEPSWIPNFSRDYTSVTLGDPEIHVTNNDPTERELPPYEPDEYTGTEETPFFFTTLAAAPGQVLGAQREETAADGAAVLGASRARGTADETTAPIARVLVMAAVAATALFLTRKKEENN